MFGETSEFHAYPIRADRPQFRTVWGFGIASIALVAVVCVLNIVTELGVWHAYRLLASAMGGTAVSAQEVLNLSSRLEAASALDLLGLVVAGIVFVNWTYSARVNAELFGGAHSQRLGRGWAVGGWVCPVVNLWFPYRIVADIYRASARRRVRSTLVAFWWAALLAGTVVMGVVTRILGNDGTAADKLRSDAQVTTVGLVFQLVAAALVMVIVARVSAWQNDPTPVDPAADAVRW